MFHQIKSWLAPWRWPPLCFDHADHIARLVFCWLFLALVISTATACNPLLKNDLDPRGEPWLRPAGSEGPVTTMGRIGAINMPTARMAEAGTIRVHSAYRAPYTMGGVAIQPLSRLELNYRRVADNRSQFERGFRFSGGLDAKLLVTTEGAYRPAMAIGIDAIAGNGIFGSEYVVASKRIGKLDLSLGMGWGRLAGHGPLANGFNLLGGHFDKPETRNEIDRGPDVWFSGDRVGLFGSARYHLPWALPWLDQQADPMSLIVEYDSDQYNQEQRFDPGFDPGDIPLSVGLETPLGGGFRGGLAVERLQQVSARLSWSWQAQRATRKPLPGEGMAPKAEDNPEPYIKRRLADLAADPPRVVEHQTIYNEQGDLPSDEDIIAERGDDALIPLEAHSSDQLLLLDAATIRHATLADTVLFRGIAATEAAPAAETVTAAISHQGLPTLSLTMQAHDLKALARQEKAPEAVWANTVVRPNQLAANDSDRSLFDRFQFELRPTLDLDGFETSSSAVARGSLNLAGHYYDADTLIGADIRLNIADNLDRLDLDRGVTAIPVRSNLQDFAENRLWIDRAYYANAFQPLPGLYSGSVTGILEEQYSGSSAQLLYWPHDAKWAVGGEINLAFARNPDDPILNFEETVLTGEVAGYYHLPGGLVAKAALTRYLGTDTGIRLDLRQTLANGWRLDTYLAFSNADELARRGTAQFAETGGADFGVRLTAPLAGLWPGLLGGAWRITPVVNIRALGRDQAQSLDLPITLYDWVAPGHTQALVTSWPGLNWH